jgi:hypothetical protein
MNYTLRSINPSETIGDSLSAINQNYNNLSNWIADIQNLYDNTFLPLYTFYIKYSTRMDRALSLIQNVSADWRSFQTTVQTNSSKWIQPLSIWYPNIILSPFNDSSLSTVGNWLSRTFPIKNADNSVNYVEGQEFIVNCHTYRSEQKVNVLYNLIDWTACRTSNSRIYAYCADLWNAQTIVCSQGSHNCAFSRNCNTSGASNCYYLTPYYNFYTDRNPIGNTPTGALIGYGKIEATVSAKYSDRFENTFIKSISFRVVDCNWSFNKFII